MEIIEIAKILSERKEEFVANDLSKYCSRNEENQLSLTLMGVDTQGLTTKAEAMRIEYLHKFLDKGGMPELIHESNSNKYISSLMNTIVRNDIANRFGVRNVDALHKMATYLVDNYGQEFVPSKVGELVGLNNKTASNYYYKDREFECDFIVANGSRVEELIQVSYDIATEKTRTQRINKGFSKIPLRQSDAHHGFIERKHSS